MDVTFVANDTRGGVDPYIALAAEAASRGHVVRAAAPPQYAQDFVAAGADFIALHGAELAQSIAAEGPISLREMGRRVTALTARWATDVAACARGTDVIVAGIGGLAVAGPVAQSVGATVMRAHLQPLDAPSSSYPGPLAPALGALGPVGRRVSHTVTAAGTSLLLRQPERAARRALALADGRPLVHPTVVYGFSSTVVPVTSDSRTTRIATGYWSPAPLPEIDAELSRFVGRPGPVVSVGFGSMSSGDPRELRRMVTLAARRAGTRVVLLSGWGAVDATDEDEDDVFVVSSVPHAWLFPRMSATVHHGGAGTTGAALTAGKPTVVVPFGADQPFWAARAHHLGVAPPPLRRSGLTETRLAASLQRVVTDGQMMQRASELGDVLRGEAGVRTAIDVLEALPSIRH